MPGPGFGGIDVRRSGSNLLLDGFLLDANGNVVTGGTTNASIFAPQSDGSLWAYDFTYNCFRPTVQTVSTTLNHRVATGTVNTGIWTGVVQATSVPNWTNRVWAAGMRWQPNGNQYHVHLDSAGRLRIGTVVSGNFTTLQDANFSFFGNRQYSVDVRVTGINPTTVSATLNDLTAGTVAATNTVTDSTAALQVPGQSGIVADGFSNANLTIPFSSVATYANAADWTQVVSDTFQRADSSPGAAGSTTAIGNGWIDNLGNTWYLNLGTVIGVTYSNTNWQTALLARPVSENQQDQRLVFTTQLALSTYQFTVGNKYYLWVNNTNASPATQVRTFQFGGGSGDEVANFTAISSAVTGVSSSVASMSASVGSVSSAVANVPTSTWSTLMSSLATSGSIGYRLAQLLSGLGTDNRPRISADAHTSGATVTAATTVTNTPSWYASPPTAAQIATAVLTDATPSNQQSPGSLGQVVASSANILSSGFVNDTSPSANSFVISLNDGQTLPTDQRFVSLSLWFIGDANLAPAKQVIQTYTSLTPTTARVTFLQPFSGAPANNSPFQIL